jgi:hypothetical protein
LGNGHGGEDLSQKEITRRSYANLIINQVFAGLFCCPLAKLSFVCTTQVINLANNVIILVYDKYLETFFFLLEQFLTDWAVFIFYGLITY